MAICPLCPVICSLNYACLLACLLGNHLLYTCLCPTSRNQHLSPMKLIATIRGQNVAKGLDILTVSQLAEELIIGPKQLSHSRMSLQMSRHFGIEETACVAAKHDKSAEKKGL